MRQRVGFARALVVHPNILLMDEPFSALDVLTAETVRTDFLELWSDGKLPIKGVILVTHNIEEAVQMCDRILLFSTNPGRIIAEIAVALPQPRDRLDPKFRALVERIYSEMMSAVTTAVSVADPFGLHRDHHAAAGSCYDEPEKGYGKAMIKDIDEYFTKGCGRCGRFATPDCSTRQWSRGLKELRRICCEVGLIETVKWAHPCYMHAGRNVAVVGALRGDFRLSFMSAALMKDPKGVLEKQGPNTRHPDMIRFTSNAQVGEMEPIILAYLKEAMGYVDAGIKPPKAEHEIDLPEELVEAMDADPELAEAFHNLTPGRQRSYVINLNSAKSTATRVSRIAKFRDKSCRERAQ